MGCVSISNHSCSIEVQSYPSSWLEIVETKDFNTERSIFTIFSSNWFTYSGSYNSTPYTTSQVPSKYKAMLAVGWKLLRWKTPAQKKIHFHHCLQQLVHLQWLRQLNVQYFDTESKIYITAALQPHFFSGCLENPTVETNTPLPAMVLVSHMLLSYASNHNVQCHSAARKAAPTLFQHKLGIDAAKK